MEKSITIRQMIKSDVKTLYLIALNAFKLDYEKYGVYPPLINTKKKKFLPPLVFGKTILLEDCIIGGLFIAKFRNKGEIGAIFLDSNYQHLGYGKQVMLMIEKMYPKVTCWKLETPADSFNLHYFYESLGYVKTGEMIDQKSNMKGYIYKKIINREMK